MTSSTGAFLDTVEKLKIPPRAILVSRGQERFKKGTVDVNMFSIGDEYAEALSQSITKLKPQVVKAASNRLSSKGAIKILSKIINMRVEEIDLSDNKIDIEAIRELVEKVLLPDKPPDLLDKMRESILINLQSKFNLSSV